MTHGTGAGIWGYDIPGGMEIAGKTGTTNDNSDAWFMGYTPQLLAGGWVGCDDRFIRFSAESKNGEGGRAAMPVWAYFMNKAAADPNCGIDTKLTFMKPDMMTNEIEIDYSNGSIPLLGGEGEDVGTGSSGDYEVPKDIKPEDILPESEVKLIIEDPKKTTVTPKTGDQKDTKKPADKPAAPDKKAKGVMPPVAKKTGGIK